MSTFDGRQVDPQTGELFGELQAIKEIEQDEQLSFVQSRLTSKTHDLNFVLDCADTGLELCLLAQRVYPFDDGEGKFLMGLIAEIFHQQKGLGIPF